jgi:hypothetical protein
VKENLKSEIEERNACKRRRKKEVRVSYRLFAGFDDPAAFIPFSFFGLVYSYEMMSIFG